MRLIPSEDSRWQPALPRINSNLLCLIVITMTIAGGLRAQPQPEIMATVNQHTISAEQFLAFFNRARRQTYYHRTPPPDELEAFRIKSLQDLINRLLLLDEAKRRGLEPDAAAVETNLARLVRRYEGNPDWEQHKEVMLASLRQQLEDGNLIEQLEEITRDVKDPSEQELRAYYENNPDTFTEPRQRRVSLIVIGVDPSSTKDVREKALEQAEGIAERLNNGDDFAMLAEAYSTDITAENGGDMGFLHEGLLNDQAEEAIAGLSPGEISPPVRTLEGYAILRLDDVREPEKKSFDSVRERAIALWKRDEAEKASETLIETLRQGAEINILDPSLAKASRPTSI